jgi:N-acetylglutamate synthase-like GNAT family acetyltransferase
MLPNGMTIRRATLDDLETLRGLWRECRLPEHELEKRFTEFQLALDSQGWILAALAVRFAGHEGQIHSLAIRRAELEDELRAALWDRILTLANQQGAYRLWTRESGSFWTGAGFTPSPSPGSSGMPAAFGDGDHWRMLKLRDEPLKMIAAEEQLEAYLEMERHRIDQLVRRGRALKIIATGFAGALFLGALSVLFVMLRRNRSPKPRR